MHVAIQENITNFNWMLPNILKLCLLFFHWTLLYFSSLDSCHPYLKFPSNVIHNSPCIYFLLSEDLNLWNAVHMLSTCWILSSPQLWHSASQSIKYYGIWDIMVIREKTQKYCLRHNFLHLYLHCGWASGRGGGKNEHSVCIFWEKLPETSFWGDLGVAYIISTWCWRDIEIFI